MTAGSTIRESWASYRECVLSPDASEVQVRETQMAFYAGAYSMLVLAAEALSASGTPCGPGVLARLAERRAECEAFRDSVAATLRQL